MDGSELTYWTEGNSCCNEHWEDAYNRFETREKEIEKFRRRLCFLGSSNWDRKSRVVELFCGSGRNLSCLESMGFKDLHGVDLSPRLLERYRGAATLYVGDATNLQFPDSFADIVIVQGGFHHLPGMPEDFERCLGQIFRILKPGGLLVMVEPWLTPFLSIVHWSCQKKGFRKFFPKLDALAVMIEEERTTYFEWLGMPEKIMELLSAKFRPLKLHFKFGKMLGVFQKN